jgi:hypothetical protein
MLEMPNDSVGENSSAVTDETPPREPVRAERFTGLRVRDTKTGQFVAGPNPHLVAKAFPWKTAATGLLSGTVGGVIANQLPQNQKDSRKLKKKLPDPSVTLTPKKKARP